MEHLKQQNIVDYNDAVVLAELPDTNEKLMQLDDLFWRQNGGDCEPLAIQDLYRVLPSAMLATLKKTPTVDNDEHASVLAYVARHVLKAKQRDNMTELPSQWLADFTATLTLLSQSQAKDLLGRSLMWLAVRFDHAAALPALLEGGVGIEATVSDGFTPLLLAAQLGNADMLTALLTHGANTKARTKRGHTALMLAARHGHTPALEALLEKNADVSAASNLGFTALMLAAQNGQIPALKALLRAGDSPLSAIPEKGVTALMCAAMEGQIEAARILIAAGANKSARESRGFTARGLAKYHNQSQTLIDLLARDPSQRSVAHFLMRSMRCFRGQ